MQGAAQTGIPCHAMIRPHANVFHCDPYDIEITTQDNSNAQLYYISDVVFGIEDKSVNLDKKTLVV